MHFTISSTDKDANQMHANPAEMISDKKLFVVMYERKHVEQVIYSLLSSFGLILLEYHSHNIFDDVEDGNKIYSVENMDKTLEFHTKICKVNQNKYETIKIKMKKIT